MSAFVVSDEHIAYILDAATQYYWKGQTRKINGRRLETGQVLLDQNYRSVNHYYEEDTLPHRYSPPPVLDIPEDAVQVIKACQCYSYQACETPDWEETEAHAIVEAVRESAIRNLPGYDGALWSIG